MRLLLLGILFFQSSAFVHGQDRPSPIDAVNVIATITDLFDAMRASDGEGIRDAFHADATMNTVVVTEQGPRLRSGDVSAFANSVASSTDRVLDERIDGIDIRIDGAMAFAWTPYRFYVDDEFSHCGANAFVLIREPSASTGWLITALTDTRRQTNCEVEEEMAPGSSVP